MLYLLDADSLIRADSTYYPLTRFPVFWQWLRHMSAAGVVKVPIEQYEVVTVGRGALVDWLKDEDVQAALLLAEEADRDLVAEVTVNGYGSDLDEAELIELGRDPFLIAYGYASPEDRVVVTFEISSPARIRARRKIPDVCRDLGIRSATLFEMIDELDFTTDWKPG